MAFRDCPHTPGVICDSRSDCRWCGWHPKEVEYRKKMIADGQMSTDAFGRKWLRVIKRKRQEVPGCATSTHAPSVGQTLTPESAVTA